MGILYPHLVKFHVRMDFIFEFSLVFYISLGGSLIVLVQKSFPAQTLRSFLNPVCFPSLVGQLYMGQTEPSMTSQEF